MFELLPYEFRELVANGYVLVLSQYLQPQQQRMVAATK
jgi:hypothetical protein